MKYKPAETSKSNTERFQKKALFAAVVAAPFFMSPASSCFAEEDKIALEEVVVTATRREENLQSVPVAISAVTSEALQDRGITNFEDIKKATAGLYLESSQGSISSSIRVRGVGSRGFSSVDSSVGLIVDGIYQPRMGTVFTEMMDIDRVEVLRGPQGTMFGKNTTAGTIMVHTKKPDTHEFSGQAQTVLGNDRTYEYRATVNIPLIEDKLAVRLSGYAANRDEGYNDNDYLGHDTRDKDLQGGRFKLLFTPTEDLDILYKAEYTENAYNSDSGTVRYGTFRGTGTTPLETIGLMLGKPLSPIGKYTQDVYENIGRVIDDNQRKQALIVNWRVAGHTLTSISGYEEEHAYTMQDRDGTSLDLSSLESVPLTRTNTQEFQIASDSDGPVEYVVGVWWQEEDVISNTGSYFGADLRTIIPAYPTQALVNTNLQNDTSAGFANLTYHLDDQWSVTGGMRYTDAKKYANQVANGTTVLIDNSENTFTEWTYTGKIKYDIDDSSMVYFSYDQGFKAGGFNRQNTAPTPPLTEDQLSFNEEITDSYEIGWKTEWLDGRIRLNGAIFRQTYDDFQVTSSIPSAASIIISNAGKVRSKGVELELTAAVTEALTVDASYAYIDSEYDEFDNASCSTIATYSGCTQDLDGQQLDNAPRRTLNIGASYQKPLNGFDGLGWFARLDASYRSEANLLDTLDTDTKMGGYTVMNARIGIETLEEQWRLTMWANNLADKEYAITAERPDIHPDGLNWVQGLPLTYGMTLDWFF